MSSTWELKEKSQGELKTTVSGDAWKGAQEKAFNKLAKKLALPGFREGKVPAAMAKKHISQQNILMEAIDEVAGEALQQGVEEHSLWMIARPELGVEAITEDEVTLTFTITVKPEVTLGDYKGLEVKKDECEVTEADIEDQIKALQDRYAELEIKEDGTVENGDTAVIDFEGFKDGIAFDGGKGENYPLEIGSNAFIPGFEEQLIGMKSEESKDINVTFPESYQEESLAGQPCVFKVTVHEIKTKALPEVNDELIKLANIEGVETVEAFKEFIKKDMLDYKEKQADEKFTNELLTKVVENAQVEVPAVMIESETDNLVNDFAQRLAQQGFNLDQFKQMTGQSDEAIREQMAVDAESKVKVRLVLDAIAVKEALNPTEEEIEAEYQRIAEMYQMDIAKVKELIDNDNISYDLRLRNAVKLIQDSTSK